jgi:hypothetical protein
MVPTRKFHSKKWQNTCISFFSFKFDSVLYLTICSIYRINYTNCECESWNFLSSCLHDLRLGSFKHGKKPLFFICCRVVILSRLPMLIIGYNHIFIGCFQVEHGYLIVFFKRMLQPIAVEIRFTVVSCCDLLYFINKTVWYLLENFTPKNGKTHVSLFFPSNLTVCCISLSKSGLSGLCESCIVFHCSFYVSFCTPGLLV